MDLNQLYRIFRSCTGVTTDSRRCPEGSLFFALRGENFDGNAYAARALEAGSAYAVVDRPEVIPPGGDARYLLTDNGLRTLQALARLHRRTLGTTMLAITGTNGKTTTKELVSAVLARRYRVLHTEGNLNNHIGVPLTLLRLRPEHELAVVEMGASHPGDIRELVDIAEPDMGLITNVGRAHLLGFGSLEGVMRTKGELFDFLREQGRGPAFVCQDDERVQALAKGLHQVRYGSMDKASMGNGQWAMDNGLPVVGDDRRTTDNGQCATDNGPLAVGDGRRASGDDGMERTKRMGLPGPHEEEACCIAGHPVDSRSPYLSLTWWRMPSSGANSAAVPGVREVHTHLIGDYNLPNVLAAAAVGSYLGVPADQIDQALEAYTPSNSRSQLLPTADNTLVVDAYNANPTSMHVSIANFLRLSAPRPLLILGDMRELGAESAHEHQRIVDELVAQGLAPSAACQPSTTCPTTASPAQSTDAWSQATVILVGQEFAATRHPFLSFPDVAALIAAVQAHKPTGRTILIKGSNGVKLGSIIGYL